MRRAAELSLSESDDDVVFGVKAVDRIGIETRFRRCVLAVTNLNPLS